MYLAFVHCGRNFTSSTGFIQAHSYIVFWVLVAWGAVYLPLRIFLF